MNVDQSELMIAIRAAKDSLVVLNAFLAEDNVTTAQRFCVQANKFLEMAHQIVARDLEAALRVYEAQRTDADQIAPIL